MTTEKLPLLALRGLTVFPNMTINFDIGREVSLKALEEAMEKDQRMFLVTQKDPNIEEPEISDLYEVGTIVYVKQMLKLPADTVRVLVEGQKRAKFLTLFSEDPYMEVGVEYSEDEENETELTAQSEALLRGLTDRFQEYGRISNRISPEVLLSVSVLTDMGEVADIVASNAFYRQEDKQEILEIFDPKERAERAIALLDREIEIQKIEQQINSRVKKQIDKMQKRTLSQRADARHTDRTWRRG